RIPQPRRQSVNGEVDAALHALVGVARAMAAQELELEVVEGVEVGEAVADRAGERRIRFEEGRGAGDLEERLRRRVELGRDAPEDRLRGRRLRREARVARRD